MNLYLDEIANEIVDNLTITDNAKQRLDQEISNLAEQFGIGQNTISLVNFNSSRSNPDLFISANGIELGEIHISPQMIEGVLQESIIVNPLAIPEKVEVAKDVTEYLKDKIGEEATKESVELLSLNKNDILKDFECMLEGMDTSEPVLENIKVLEPVAETLSAPENSSIQNRPLQDPSIEGVFKNINKQLSAAGIDTKEVEKKQSSILKNIEKEEKKEARVSKKEAKRELKDVKREIDDLYSALRHETSVAKLNGYPPENAEHITAIGNKIAEKTLMAAQLESRVPMLKNNVLESIQSAANETKQSINKGFDKIKESFGMKVRSGINAISGITDKVARANEKFSSMRDTAYTNLSEKVEQINRNWLSLNYAIDRTIVKELTKIHSMYEHQYNQRAEIKGAARDLANAIVGKERTGAPAALTNNQKETLANLKKMTESISGNMKELSMDYETSKQTSLLNMKGAKEFREDVGLNLSESLEKTIQKAREKSIEGKKNTPEAEKKQPNKNAGEKTR